MEFFWTSARLFLKDAYFLSFLAIFFSGPVQDYFSRKHISELFGSGFFLDQCQIIFSGETYFRSFWQWIFPGPVLDSFSRKKNIIEVFGCIFYLDQCKDLFF